MFCLLKVYVRNATNLDRVSSIPNEYKYLPDRYI